MKKIFMIMMSIIMLAVTNTTFTSCSKDDNDTENYSSVKSQLQGTWKGRYATAYTDGEPSAYSDMVITFSGDKVTLDGKTFTYTIDKSVDGKLYFQLDNGDAIFFSVSGSELKILSTNGSAYMFLIGSTLTKQ